MSPAMAGEMMSRVVTRASPGRSGGGEAFSAAAGERTGSLSSLSWA